MSLKYLSQNQLSEITGKDRRTIKKRLEGVKPNSQDGRSNQYETQKVLPLIYAPESSFGIERKLQEEQLRYERARADKMVMEVAKRNDELIEVESVAEDVEKEYAAVTAALRALPTKLAMSAAHREPHEVKALLEEAINELLIELSADKKYESIGDEHEGESAEAAPSLPEDISSPTDP